MVDPEQCGAGELPDLLSGAEEKLGPEPEVVVVESEGDESLSDPYSIVEEVLAENAELCARVDGHWRNIRAGQHQLRDIPPELARYIAIRTFEEQEHTVGGKNSLLRPPGEREIRRLSTGTSEKLSRQEIQNAHAEASNFYVSWSKRATDLSSEAVEAAAMSYTSAALENHAFVETLTTHFSVEQRSAIAEQRREYQARATELGREYIRAFAAQDALVITLEAALSNDSLVLPFIERILGLAQDARDGIVEFPGLLETLAVHQEQTKRRNTIATAFGRVLGPGLEAEFIDKLLAPGQPALKVTKELASLVAGIQLTAELVGRASGSPLVNLKALLIEYRGLWPADLTTRFTKYKDSVASERQDEVREALEAHLQRGRLPMPAPVAARSADYLPYGAKLKPEQVTARRSQRGRRTRGGQQKDGRAGDEARRAADTEDLTPETQEMPRITRFATFKRVGGGKAFALEKLNSIDDFMQLPDVVGYINRHKTEPDLINVLRACFEYLVIRPFDDRATRRINNGLYSVWNDGKVSRRRMCRMSPRRLPDIPTSGPVSSDTRILYDVVSIKTEEEGSDERERCLVLLGVWHKNQLLKKDTLF